MNNIKQKTVNKPFKNFIDNLKLNKEFTQKQIACKLGVGNSYLSSVINGKHPLTNSLKEKLFTVFGVQLEITEKGQVVNIKDSETDVKMGITSTYVKLLPIYSLGTPIKDFDLTNDNTCEMMISPVKDAELAIVVPDDSMAPEFTFGSRIFIKKIDLAFIPWGKILVLDTINGPMIRIVNRSERDGYLLCTSIHENQQRYSPFEIPYTSNAIYGIYRPLLVVTLK